MQRTLGSGAQKLQDAWEMGSLGLIIACRPSCARFGATRGVDLCVS